MIYETGAPPVNDTENSDPSIKYATLALNNLRKQITKQARHINTNYT